MTVAAWRRWLPLAALGAGRGRLCTLPGLHHHLSLERAAAEHGGAAERWSPPTRCWRRCVFMAVYAAAAALSLPGALLLTLAGGFLFGTVARRPWAVLGGHGRGGDGVPDRPYRPRRCSCGERAGPWLQRLEAGFSATPSPTCWCCAWCRCCRSGWSTSSRRCWACRARLHARRDPVGIIPAAFVYAGIGSGLGASARRGGAAGSRPDPRAAGPVAAPGPGRPGAAAGGLPALEAGGRARPRAAGFGSAAAGPCAGTCRAGGRLSSAGRTGVSSGRR